MDTFKNISLTRLLVGGATALVSLALILLSHSTWGWLLISGTIFSLIWVGLDEFATICRLKGIDLDEKAIRVLSFLFLLTTVEFPEKVFFLPVLLGFILVSFLALFLRAFYQKNSSPLLTLSISLFGLFYLVFPLISIYRICFFDPSLTFLWLFYLVSVTKASDMMGYFIGVRWGKNRLAPYISPKKTYEGAGGGLAASIVVSLLVFKFSSLEGSFVEAITLGLAIGCLAQIGDLSESLLKREVSLKDSNNIPGVGGILDLVDSLLFSTPFLLFYLSIR